MFVQSDRYLLSGFGLPVPRPGLLCTHSPDLGSPRPRQNASVTGTRFSRQEPTSNCVSAFSLTSLPFATRFRWLDYRVKTCAKSRKEPLQSRKDALHRYFQAKKEAVPSGTAQFMRLFFDFLRVFHVAVKFHVFAICILASDLNA